MIYLAPLNTIILAIQPLMMQDFMRSTGKIMVVVASLLIIFFGLIVFLYFVEKRISKIEKELNNE